MENGKIAAAFVKAQKAFAPALKSSTNPHFKSKYVNLDGCIEAVIDALNDNGIGLIQKTHECESGVAVETILMHESGEVISGGIFKAPAIKNDPQAYGSALTYARRYSLMSTCGIAPEDDDGNAAKKAYDNKRNQIEKQKQALVINSELFSKVKFAFDASDDKAGAIIKIKEKYIVSDDVLNMLNT